MFNEDEYTTEDRAAGVWGALLLMATLGSCANMPKYANQDQRPEKVPVKIEQHQDISTNQFYKAPRPYLIYVR